jgi:hypothetical protein
LFDRMIHTLHANSTSFIYALRANSTSFGRRTFR